MRGRVNGLFTTQVLRSKVGAAARKFMDKYFHDSDYMGRVFVGHLIEVADAGPTPLKRRKSSARFA